MQCDQNVAAYKYAALSRLHRLKRIKNTEWEVFQTSCIARVGNHN